MTVADELFAAADQVDEAARTAGDAFALMSGIGTQTGLVGTTKSGTAVLDGVSDALNAALSTQSECADLAAMLRARAVEYQAYLAEFSTWKSEIWMFEEGKRSTEPPTPTKPWWAN